MSLKQELVYVKDNYLLSRDRVTVMTMLSSADGNMASHIVFKGKGRDDYLLNLPPGIKNSLVRERVLPAGYDAEDNSRTAGLDTQRCLPWADVQAVPGDDSGRLFSSPHDGGKYYDKLSSHIKVSDID